MAVEVFDFEITVDRQCADVIKMATNIDVLAGADYARFYGNVARYDDDFGAAPYVEGDIFVEAEEDVAPDKLRGALIKLVSMQEIFEAAKESEKIDLCELLVSIGLLNEFCVDIDVVEKAVNRYTIRVIAAKEDDARKIVQREIDAGVGEVFARYSVEDEEIVEVLYSEKESIARVWECKED